MSKKIGLIAEDDSDIKVINEILKKYLKEDSFKIKKFIGNGCGKLNQKCAAWTKNLISQGCNYVIIFHDLDRNKENTLRKSLETKVCPKSYPNSLVVIPKEELEAWLLSDSLAIKKALNLSKCPPQIHNSEEVKSPKEELVKIVYKVDKKRYLNTIHNEKVAVHLSLENLKKCKSFMPLNDFILEKIC